MAKAYHLDQVCPVRGIPRGPLSAVDYWWRGEPLPTRFLKPHFGGAYESSSAQVPRLLDLLHELRFNKAAEEVMA